jgi:hypothetical protein
MAIKATPGGAAIDWFNSGNVKNIVIGSATGEQVLVVPRSSTVYAVFSNAGDETSNWIEQTTITVSAIRTGASGYKAVVNHDGTKIFLMYICADNSVKSRIINIADKTATAEETVWPATAGITPNYTDIQVSPGGAVLAGFVYQGPAGDAVGYVTRIRYTTTPAWVAVEKVTISATDAPRSYCNEFALGWYNTASATARRFSVLVALGISSGDVGVRHVHCSINETTGTAFSKQDKGILPFGGLNYTSYNLNFTNIPRVMRVERIADPATSVFAISSTQFVSSPGGLTYASYDVGSFRITSSGVNAAGDVVTSQAQTFPDSNWRTRNDLVNKSLGFYLDDTGLPGFAFGDIVTGGSAVFSMGYGITITNASTGTLSIQVMKNGDLLSFSAPSSNTNFMTGTVGTSTTVDYANARRQLISYFNNAGAINRVAYRELFKSFVGAWAGSTLTTSEPSFNVPVGVSTTDINSQSLGEAIAQIQVALDSGFSTGVQTVQTIPKLLQRSSSQTFYIPGDWNVSPISSGLRYFRTRVKNAFGSFGPWTAASQFVIDHPGLATNVQPAYSSTDPLPFAYSDPASVGYSEHYVSWDFSDSWNHDYQTAYRITLYDTATNAQVWTSGKQASANKNALLRVPFASRNKKMFFIVEAWDSYDTTAASTSTSYGSLISQSGPFVSTFTCTTVDGNGKINAAAPTFSYTIVDGFRATAYIDFEISKNGSTISTTRVVNPPASGTVSFPSVLENNTSYTIKAIATDTGGLKYTATIQGTTLWTPPGAPTGIVVSLANYNVENKAYVEVSWSNAAKDANWIAWTVYRRVNQINQYTGAVVETGDLVKVATTYEDATTLRYLDYEAPSGCQVDYVIRQMVNRQNSIIESVNTAATSVSPVSDGYWLIDPTPEDATKSAFKLVSVTSDAYSLKHESQMTYIIGRGMHEDRGGSFGHDGSLSAQLRDTGATTARQKKLRIESIQDEARSLLLRNPFGDIWYVAVGDIAVDRLAGTGLSEFCDITLPYQEVYNDRS